MTEILALVHDVFGTVVDWRGAVTADGAALGARLGISGVDWQQFADEWRGLYAPVMMVAAHNNDLVQAAKHGMRTAYINRPYERGAKQDRDFTAEHDFTYVADGFEDLATQLGI